MKEHKGPAVCVCGRVLAFENQVCHNSADPVFSGGIPG